jgi:2-haloacid dehalogenase
LPIDTGRVELVSFDVFGTLIQVRESSYAAFARILDAAGGREKVDLEAFWEHWEEASIMAYWEPYRPYKEIVARSLHACLDRFGLAPQRDLIQHYFDSFPSFELFADVLPALDALARRFRLALVSNIDDDLLRATPLLRDHGRRFDYVCTAEQARGYKPDGTLFRHLLSLSHLEPGAILHCGQSQLTDMVGAKPLGIPVAWINRRNVPLQSGVPMPDWECRSIGELLRRMAPAAS